MQAHNMQEQLRVMLKQQADSMAAAHAEEMRKTRDNMLVQLESAREVVTGAPPPPPQYESTMPHEEPLPVQISGGDRFEGQMRSIVREEMRAYFEQQMANSPQRTIPAASPPPSVAAPQDVYSYPVRGYIPGNRRL
jgi:hypothetical protein